MKSIIRLSLLLQAFINLNACKEEKGRTETIYISEENKGWSTEEDLGSNFVLVASNGISQSFTKRISTTDFIESSSSDMVFDKKTTLRENKYEKYTSNFGREHTILLAAQYEIKGEEISVTFDDLLFTYDFKFQTITRLSTHMGHKGKNLLEGYYAPDGAPTYSTVEILHSYTTRFHNYDEVLHFQLKDFSEHWNELTISDIYIAKNVGLVKITYHGGLCFERD